MINGLTQQFSSECSQRLLRLLSIPLALFPSYIHSGILAGVLNGIMANLIVSGDLGFLEQRVVCVRVEDAAIRFGLQLRNGRFKACGDIKSPDVVISGTAYDFLVLATRQEDADTLFFQRRLKLEGDTELGLALKNQLDGMEWDSISLPLPLRKAVKKGASLINALYKISDWWTKFFWAL